MMMINQILLEQQPSILMKRLTTVSLVKNLAVRASIRILANLLIQFLLGIYLSKPKESNLKSFSMNLVKLFQSDYQHIQIQAVLKGTYMYNAYIYSLLVIVFFHSFIH